MRAAVCFITALLLFTFLLPPCNASSENLCEGATIYAFSGYINDEEQPAYLIDGDLDTKWCSTEGTITDYSLSSLCKQYIIIDLGSEVTFNTYRLYGAGEHGRDTGNLEMNPLEWQMDVSSDAKSWNEVSYVSGNPLCDVQVHLGNDVTARYVRLLVIEPTQIMENVVRLYELELTNADPVDANTINALSGSLTKNTGAEDEASDSTAAVESGADDASGDSADGDDDEGDATTVNSGPESIAPVIVVIIAAAAAIGATAAIVFTRNKNNG